MSYDVKINSECLIALQPTYTGRIDKTDVGINVQATLDSSHTTFFHVR